MQREPGTYRGTVVETTVVKTDPKEGKHQGLPRFDIRIQPTEVYDFTDREWYAVDPENQLADTGYLHLCNAEKGFYTIDQIRETFGWNGTTFPDLAHQDYAGRQVQYGMAFGDGDFADKIGMTGIRPFDATPFGALRSATDDDLKSLDAEFGGFLKNSAKAPTTIPPTAPKPPKAKKKKALTPEAPTPEAPITGEPPKTPPKPKTLPDTPPGTPAPAAPATTNAAIDAAKIQAVLDELPEVTDKETCWAVVKEQADTYLAKEENVLIWWNDFCKQYPGEWDTTKVEIVREILKAVPF